MRRPPFLPFVDGPPAFKVGLAPIALEDWLAPDWEAGAIGAKRALMAAGVEIVREDAARAGEIAEASALVADALGAPQTRTLAEASLLASDDLVVLLPDNGAWRVVAAALASPTFFSLGEAFGSSLAQLHRPVPDTLGPGGAQGLADRIARVFDRLPADRPLERFNWTVQAGPDRFTPSIAPLLARAGALAAADALDQVFLRVERQTIRRLPECGGVLFTIRVSLDPLRAALAEPGACAALAAAWFGAHPAVRAYKKWSHYDHLIRPLLA